MYSIILYCIPACVSQSSHTEEVNMNSTSTNAVEKQGLPMSFSGELYTAFYCFSFTFSNGWQIQEVHFPYKYQLLVSF